MRRRRDAEGITLYFGESTIDRRTQRVNPEADRPYAFDKCGTSLAKPVRIDRPARFE